MSIEVIGGAIECFICRLSRVGSRWTEEIESVFCLWCKMMPQLERKLGVGST